MVSQASKVEHEGQGGRFESERRCSKDARVKVVEWWRRKEEAIGRMGSEFEAAKCPRIRKGREGNFAAIFHLELARRTRSSNSILQESSTPKFLEIQYKSKM